jgi:hypothetical protein
MAVFCPVRLLNLSNKARRLSVLLGAISVAALFFATIAVFAARASEAMEIRIAAYGFIITSVVFLYAALAVEFSGNVARCISKAKGIRFGIRKTNRFAKGRVSEALCHARSYARAHRSPNRPSASSGGGDSGDSDDGGSDSGPSGDPPRLYHPFVAPSFFSSEFDAFPLPWFPHGCWRMACCKYAARRWAA